MDGMNIGYARVSTENQNLDCRRAWFDYAMRETRGAGFSSMLSG
jgi:DNA invertase Pin-like site-specific DNA recombinase